jgi:hypothetical protein
MVLTLEILKTGIIGYTFTPAWIDEYIPHPATGSLGREIMDRMADYSRPMNALVATHPDESWARVHISRASADSSVHEQNAEAALVDQNGVSVSPPLPLAGQGNLSSVVEITGDVGAGWEVRWGREILWHGGFEPEGATFWDVNTEDEWLDETESHSGGRSLALRRSDNEQNQTGTDLEKHLPCDPGKKHSCWGWLKADNADAAVMMARFYEGRSSGQPINSTDLAEPFEGSQDWTLQWRDLQTPPDANYFEVRCQLEGPDSGTGHAWFDDIRFIEWEPWIAADGELAVPSPNNFRFLQVRHPGPATTVTVTYEETVYDALPTAVEEEMVLPLQTRVRNFPNPFNPRTTIEVALPMASGPLPVSVLVYDLRGRKVADLFNGSLVGGTRHGFSFDGRDSRGKNLASGTYFARVRVDGRTHTAKMLLIR